MASGFQISNFKFPIRSVAARVAVGLTALVSSVSAHAQTCPACYANAAAQAPGMLQALKTGILVMMFPSLLMFIVIFAVAYRRRDSFQETSGDEAEFNQDLRLVGTPEAGAAFMRVQYPAKPGQAFEGERPG